ncbi:MAG: Fe-S cluster assembly protein SufD [Chlamydiales bacterium]
MQQAFLEELKKQSAHLNTEGKLKSLQDEAFDTVVQRGLPEKKQGDFQYIPLEKIYGTVFSLCPQSLALPSKEEISSHLLPECQKSFILFVDGVFVPELSAPPEKMLLLPLAKALHSYGPFLQTRLHSTIQQESDPFALLNLALMRGGVFAYLPPMTQIATPVQCLHFLTQEGVLASPRIQLFAGKSSSCTLLSTFHLKADGLINSLVDLHLEEGAKVEQTSLFSDESDSCLFEALRVTLKRDAAFKGVTISRGGKTHRQSFSLSLNGENAQVDLGGVWLLRKELSTHVHVLIDHQAPHTRSKQHFKGVVNDASQSSFEGKIHVRQAAQKTEAYQLNSNLILSERAQAFCKPNLEIFADDVKASHGATIGELDEEALFYLKTRGIAEKEAKKLLVNAFCEEIGTKITIPSLHAKFKEDLTEFLEVEATKR